MHLRCPQCKVAIEFLNDASSEAVSCPSCGADFSTSEENTIIASGDVGGTTDAATVEESHVLPDFELICELGTGAFGSVWKARDRRLGRFVAIKKPRERVGRPISAETFLAEAQATAALRHHHIVTVYDVLRDGALWYIVSDFVDGQTLKDVLLNGSLTESEAIAITLKVAEALHYAHEKGIIHRDLKPANIMVDSTGEPRVMDFGLAKRDAAEFTVNREGVVLGTPAYMSPEQARGDSDSADRRSDVYSLGVILYEMVAGVRPFDGRKQMLLDQVVNAEPCSPRQHRRSVSRDLETLCLKCLQKRPNQRFATAQDLANELRRLQLGEPIRSRPVTSIERLIRWAKRKPMIAGLTALLLLVVIVGGSVLTIQQREKQALEKGMSQLGVSESEARIAHSQARAEVTETRNQMTRQEIIERSRRLAIRSAEVRIASPILSMLLAIESVDEAQRDGGDVTSSALTALYASLDVTGGRPMTGHSGPIRCTAFTSDSKRAITGSKDTTVRIWDVNTEIPQTIHVLKGHLHGVSSMALSPDGRWLATAAIRPMMEFGGSFDFDIPMDDEPDPVEFTVDIVRLWDLKKNDPASTVVELSEHEIDVTKLAISETGRWLATGDLSGEIRIWDLQAANITASSIVLPGHTKAITALVFDPMSNDRLATTSEDGSVRLWNLSGKNPVESVLVLAGHTAPVRGAAFEMLASYLITISDDQTIRVWNTDEFNADQETITMKAHRGAISILAVDPNRSYAATFSGGPNVFATGEIELWELGAVQPENGVRIFDTVDLHYPTAITFGGEVESLGILEVLMAAFDDGVIRLWDVFGEPVGRVICELRGHEGSLTTIAVSKDGRWLIGGGESPVPRLWPLGHSDPQTSAIVAESMLDVKIDAACRAIAVGDLGHGRELWLLSEASDEPIKRPLQGHAASISVVESSPDGRWVVTADSDGAILLWDASQSIGEFPAIGLRESGSVVQHALFDDSSRWLITVDTNDVFEVRDVSRDSETGTPLVSSDLNSPVQNIGFSRDGSRLFMTCKDLRAYVLERNDDGWKQLQELPVKADKIGIVLTADWLVLDGGIDEIRVLDLKEKSIDEAVLQTMLSGDRLQLGVCAADQHWLLLEGDNGEILLGDLRSGSIEISVLEGHRAPISNAIISAEDGIVVTRSEDGEVRRWYLPQENRSSVEVVNGLIGEFRGEFVEMLVTSDLKLILGSDRGSIQMWDLKVEQPAADPVILRRSGEAIDLLAVDPSGRWLVSEDFAETRIWDLHLKSLRDRVRRIAGRELTTAERATYARLLDTEESASE